MEEKKKRKPPNPTGKGGLHERPEDMRKGTPALIKKFQKESEKKAIRLEDYYNDMLALSLAVVFDRPTDVHYVEYLEGRDRLKHLKVCMEKVERFKEMKEVEAEWQEERDSVKAQVGQLMHQSFEKDERIRYLEERLAEKEPTPSNPPAKSKGYPP